LDLRLGQGDDWFGAVADIGSIGDGRFAVLDQMERNVSVFDSLGNRVARYGREGDGPGEFRAPWALAAAGEHLVVWQPRASGTFTVFRTDGSLRASQGPVADGDWAEPLYRFPLLNLLGGQFGPEDVTHRLAPLGDSGFVHQLQLNEKEHIDFKTPVDFPAPPVFLIRYTLDARLQDTLAVLPGPPTLVRDRFPTAGQIVVVYEQPLFSGRPVWATGEGWLALGHGDSAQVVVQRLTGDTALIVRWPSDTVAVSDEDKIEAAKWVVASRILNSPESRQMFEEHSRRERREGIEFEAFQNLPFAEQAPKVTAAYGAERCLFLSGFEPGDWVDGTALTWAVLNVEKGSLEAVIRVPPPQGKPLELNRRGAVVREFDSQFVYTVFRDSDGVFLVGRYRLPRMDCER
jgi:hypothetical protein